MEAGDLDWAAGLAAVRRGQRESFAPRFWRPAPDARRLHTRYLASLIGAPDVAAMRTDHLFAFGISRAGTVLVDDAAADDEDRWAGEGPALVRHLAGKSRVRFVCPVPEPSRGALAIELGLRCAETWWHRDLPEPRPGSPVDGPLRAGGARGTLVEAPPVYAPGGPVLLVAEFRDRRALADIEREAARRGAPVSVVTQLAGDGVREEILSEAGYRRTCDFYEGTVRPGQRAPGVPR
jgi:hypothetical protein